MEPASNPIAPRATLIRPPEVTCTRCRMRYYGAVCHLCKLGKNGRDYQ